MFQSLETSVAPVKLLLIGEPGVGKTRLASQLASEGKVAIINFDKNLTSLRQLPQEVQKNIVAVNPYLSPADGKEVPVTKTFTNFMQQMGILLEEPDICTIVIDSLTSWAMSLHWQLLGRIDPMAKPAGFDHWQYFGSHWKYFATEILQAGDLDKNIVLIAHDEIVKDINSGETTRRVKMDGSMRDDMGSFFTDMWRGVPTIPTSGPIKYTFVTGPGKGFAGKSTLPEKFKVSFDATSDLTEIKKHFPLCNSSVK